MVGRLGGGGREIVCGRPIRRAARGWHPKRAAPGEAILSNANVSESRLPVTRPTTIEPTGITAPLDPMTAPVTVAVNASPTRLFPTHNSTAEANARLVPAAITPSSRAPLSPVSDADLSLTAPPTAGPPAPGARP